MSETVASETVASEIVTVNTVPVNTVPVNTVPVNTVPVNTVPVNTVCKDCSNQTDPITLEDLSELPPEFLFQVKDDKVTHCFDIRSLHEYYTSCGKLENPLTRTIFSEETLTAFLKRVLELGLTQPKHVVQIKRERTEQERERERQEELAEIRDALGADAAFYLPNGHDHHHRHHSHRRREHRDNINAERLGRFANNAMARAMLRSGMDGVDTLISFSGGPRSRVEARSVHRDETHAFPRETTGAREARETRDARETREARGMPTREAREARESRSQRISTQPRQPSMRPSESVTPFSSPQKREAISRPVLTTRPQQPRPLASQPSIHSPMPPRQRSEPWLDTRPLDFLQPSSDGSRQLQQPLQHPQPHPLYTSWNPHMFQEVPIQPTVFPSTWGQEQPVQETQRSMQAPQRSMQETRQKWPVHGPRQGQSTPSILSRQPNMVSVREAHQSVSHDANSQPLVSQERGKIETEMPQPRNFPERDVSSSVLIALLLGLGAFLVYLLLR